MGDEDCFSIPIKKIEKKTVLDNLGCFFQYTQKDLFKSLYTSIPQCETIKRIIQYADLM